MLLHGKVNLRQKWTRLVVATWTRFNMIFCSFKSHCYNMQTGTYCIPNVFNRWPTIYGLPEKTEINFSFGNNNFAVPGNGSLYTIVHRVYFWTSEPYFRSRFRDVSGNRFVLPGGFRRKAKKKKKTPLADPQPFRKTIGVHPYGIVVEEVAESIRSCKRDECRWIFFSRWTCSPDFGLRSSLDVYTPHSCTCSSARVRTNTLARAMRYIYLTRICIFRFFL